MKIKRKNLIVIVGLIAIVLIAGLYYLAFNTGESKIVSPYAGQELERGIKALSQEEVKGLLAGEGTPFGGMAKPAELNGYPGPRHVLDAVEYGEIELTDEQEKQIRELYEEMKVEAIDLGKKIIDIEKEIDKAFVDKTITEIFLKEKVEESSKLYGELRFVHLKYHLSTMEILTQEQVEQYNELRGYTNSEIDPCDNIPKGHDPEMWRLHNGCN